ncbi:MAG: hypothetical protein IKZ87_04650 [Actinomycetaceae bacterium]|nr:hypothetical protein [Actinomycetaceae bacterium]
MEKTYDLLGFLNFLTKDGWDSGANNTPWLKLTSAEVVVVDGQRKLQVVAANCKRRDGTPATWLVELT